ncbi:FAD dependent oxidoreductase [Jimgerdemannia flammicorona]|uniref:FAD dependent oxidoreductase n=1 Tax=Jimgerdemannia flammicorona TaxID=994334 RepID=A0A433D0U6_9FUNG|nr:FAD dependent oxidoreductase [Jimgerdemannia flammicorona]
MLDHPVLPWPSTEPYWLQKMPWQAETQAPLPEKADVVVVGAGVTGLSTAYWLRQLRPELKVVVIEARGVSSGATGRNGGLCWPGLNDSFRQAVARYGLPAAKKFIKFEYTSFNAMRDFISRHCDTDGGAFDPQMTLMPQGALLLFVTDDQVRNGHMNLEALKHAGLADGAIELTRDQVANMTGSDSFLGGIQVKTVAILWAAKFVFALAREATRPATEHGPVVDIHTFTRAQSVVRDPATGLLTVDTSRGRITAANVVHATNAWAWSILPAFRDRIIPVRNQVIFVRPPRAHPRLWDFICSANNGYEYLSQRPNGDVILGGMRETVEGGEEGNPDDSTLNPKISSGLRRYLPETFEVFREGGEEVHAEMEWCGVMGFSEDRLPFVGSLEGVLGKEEGRGQWIAAGFTGHGEDRIYNCVCYHFEGPFLLSLKPILLNFIILTGMTRTFLCGRAIAEMVTGMPVSDWFVDEFLPDHHASRRDMWRKLDVNASAKL